MITFKNMPIKAKAERVVVYTNMRLNSWYKIAFEDYGVIGSGIANYDEETNAIIITFTEYGKIHKFEMECWIDEPIDYTFNVWMDFAEY